MLKNRQEITKDISVSYVIRNLLDFVQKVHSHHILELFILSAYIISSIYKKKKSNIQKCFPNTTRRNVGGKTLPWSNTLWKPHEQPPSVKHALLFSVSCLLTLSPLTDCPWAAYTKCSLVTNTAVSFYLPFGTSITDIYCEIRKTHRYLMFFVG